MALGRRRVSALGVSFAVHVVAAVVITWVAPALKPVARTFTARLAVVTSVPPADRTVAPVRRTAVPADPIVAIPDDLNIPLQPGDDHFSLPGFAFDFEKIVTHATELFPFVTGSVSLEALTVPRASGLAGLSRLLSILRGSRSKPPLMLGDDELQALIDRSWSRRERWRAFAPIASVAAVHDADDGRLPALLREYGIQNGLQPYAEPRLRDPRLWAQLGLVADHPEFIDFISQFAAEHPGSKATIELLFVVDKLAQASLDALLTLIVTRPDTELQWTRLTNRRAFEALVTIRDYYQVQLERRDLSSPRALSAYYDEVRLAILRGVLRTTPDGYRSSDARFLIGEIEWKRGKREEAVATWREMTIDPAGAYSRSSTQLLDTLRAPGGRIDVRRINGILDAEQGRWLMLTLGRLRQFGYHLDTF
jgi:hypothetical protein